MSGLSHPIPIKVDLDRLAVIDAISQAHNTSRSEVMRRLMYLGMADYGREMDPGRTRTDGLADALDEVGRRVAEFVGPQEQDDAWQVVNRWVSERNLPRTERLYAPQQS